MPDTFVLPLATQLFTCLQNAANANPNPPANYCYRIGNNPPHDLDFYTDLCCEGLGYLTLGDIFPSTDSFGEADIVRQAQSSCPPASWAVTFKIAIVRCAPTGTDLTMPTCDAWTAAFQQNVQDAQALRAAACCFRAYIQDNSGAYFGMSTIIGRQSQGEPQGGCVERSVDIMAQIPNCDCTETP